MSYINIITLLRHWDDKISDSAIESENGGDEEKYKNMGLETLRFRIKALWREGLQFLLSIREMSCQKPLCQTVANVGVKRFA